MKKALSLLLCLNIFAIAGCSKTKNDPLSQEDYLADFDQCIHEFRAHHENLFVYRTEDDFNEFVESQRSRITNDISVYEFYNLISELCAYPQCFHSGVGLGGNYYKDQFFPFKTHYDGNDLWVVCDQRSQPDGQEGVTNTIAPGSKVLSVNGEPIAVLLDSLSRTIPADGGIESMIVRTIDSRFQFIFSRWSGFPSEYEIQYLEPDPSSVDPNWTQKSETALIKTDSFASIRRQDMYSRDSEEKLETLSANPALDLIVNEELSAARLVIKHFSWYKRKDKEFYNQFLSSSFETIRSNSVKNLIIDIRGNQGGDPFASAELLNYIVSKPYVYFENTGGFTGGLIYRSLRKPQIPKKNRFKGKVFLWVNGLNGSSAGHFSSLMKYHNLATFIGETTGSTYFCSGNPKGFELTNTGFRIGIGQKSFSTAVDGFEKGVGISVDYVLKPSLNDLIEKNDPFPDFTFRIIDGSI